MLAICKDISDTNLAKLLLSRMKETSIDVNSIDCTQLISVFSNSGQIHMAMEVLALMDKRGIQPDALTYCALLKGITSPTHLKLGKRIHARLTTNTLTTQVQNLLLNMYCKCGSMETAAEFFVTVQPKNVYSWTTLISAFVDAKQPEHVKDLYNEMLLTKVEPNEVTYTSLLKACAQLADLEWGTLLHKEILQKQVPLTMPLRTTLLSMYSRCGELSSARDIFEDISTSSTLDIVAWNAMISSLVDNDNGLEAITISNRMKQVQLQINYSYLL